MPTVRVDRRPFDEPSGLGPETGSTTAAGDASEREVVLVREQATNPRGAVTLTHELVHVTQYGTSAFRDRGTTTVTSGPERAVIGGRPPTSPTPTPAGSRRITGRPTTSGPATGTGPGPGSSWSRSTGSGSGTTPDASTAPAGSTPSAGGPPLGRGTAPRDSSRDGPVRVARVHRRELVGRRGRPDGRTPAPDGTDDRAERLDRGPRCRRLGRRPTRRITSEGHRRERRPPGVRVDRSASTPDNTWRSGARSDGGSTGVSTASCEVTFVDRAAIEVRTVARRARRPRGGAVARRRRRLPRRRTDRTVVVLAGVPGVVRETTVGVTDAGSDTGSPDGTDRSERGRSGHQQRDAEGDEQSDERDGRADDDVTGRVATLWRRLARRSVLHGIRRGRRRAVPVVAHG